MDEQKMRVGDDPARVRKDCQENLADVEEGIRQALAGGPGLHLHVLIEERDCLRGRTTRMRSGDGLC